MRNSRRVLSDRKPMNKSTTMESEREPRDGPRHAGLALADGWRAELERRERGAVLRLSHGAQSRDVELEIRFGDEGPVVRARAAAVEVESEGDFVARCGRFRVEARDAVELLSAGAMRAEAREIDVRATLGSARVRANDDVQLLGEQILLNCDRPAALPRWLASPSRAEQTVERQDEGGDPDLGRAIES